MASTKVTWNDSAVQEYLDGGHGVEAVLDSRAQRVESTAQGLAPVATGAYRDSIHVETDRTDRMVKRVVADAPHAFIVEARDGVLARSLDAAGGS